MRHANNNWIDETSSSSTGLLTLTAAWCWLRVWRGVLLLLIVLMLASQTNSKLSFPPLARNFPSGDHFNPHTSWECLANVATWWWATRTSWWCIAPLLHPLKQYWTKKKKQLNHCSRGSVMPFENYMKDGMATSAAVGEWWKWWLLDNRWNNYWKDSRVPGRNWTHDLHDTAWMP